MYQSWVWCVKLSTTELKFYCYTDARGDIGQWDPCDYRIQGRRSKEAQG